MTDRKIAENLKKLRRESGLTQEQMSDKMGICRATYNNLETGKTTLINEHLYSAAKVLDCPPEKLVGGYDKDNSGMQALRDIQEECDALRRENAELLEEVGRLKDDIQILKQLNAYRQAEIEKLSK